MDRLSKEHRSWNMSRIRGKDTKPELIVRSMLHRMGYRFRLHVKDLPGKPDIVLPKYRTVIFVHGCFWHRHAGCRFAYAPKSRRMFWTAKFAETVARDRRNTAQLRRAGWQVIAIWACQVLRAETLSTRLRRKLQPLPANEPLELLIDLCAVIDN